MSTDMFVSQTAPRSPATDFQTDKIGSCGLNQSSKTKIFRDLMKGNRDNFLNTLKKVTQDRVLNKRLKFAPDESLPVTGAPFDVRDMDEALPNQKAPDWKFMAVIKVLVNLGFHDAIGGSDLQSMINGNQPDGKQAAPIKMLIARLLQNQIVPTADLKAGLVKLQQFLANGVASFNSHSDAKMKISSSAGGGTATSDEMTARLSNLNSAVDITEAGNNDNGLLNSSGQQSKKNVEAAPSPKETESNQRILRYQITDQIIRKAAFHLKNGQHEVIIDLKSDFLGHIRMQVISENQKVTVRILVENGFVKDLIESNLNQLKADLQQQGLEVDKLEVRVACDPEDSGSSIEQFAQWRAGQGNVHHQKHDNQKDEQQNDNGQPPRTANNAATVDYFA